MTKKDEKQQPSEELVKINKWDGCAVKHALDDAVRNALMDRPNMKEQFGLINARLVLCSLSVGAAVFAHCWDYKHPFPESRPVLLYSVISYFILMGILTLHTTFRERGIFAVAIQKEPNGNERLWEASSDMKKYDDKYTLILSMKDATSSRKLTMTKSCANFIDVNGIVIEQSVRNEVKHLFNSLSADKSKDK